MKTVQVVDNEIKGFGELVRTADKDGNEKEIINVEVSDELFQAIIDDRNSYDFESEIIFVPKYIYSNGEIIIDPDYETKKEQKERERLDALTLTPADVERALYKAKGMDFEDLKTLIAQKIPSIDIKGLAIEFRAKDFYRGAVANGVRLFDTVGALLGYTIEDMDYLFEHKELPINLGE